MAKIRVVALPVGLAPEHIRKSSVGLEMPLQDEDAERYYVDLESLLAALTERGDHLIASWWKVWGKEIGYVYNDSVHFGKEFCEFIQ
jgi:hypothetical protein